MLKLILDIVTNNHDMMDWWFETFGSFAWLIMICGGILYIGIGLLFSYLVHKDALKNQIRNPDLWMIAAFVLNIIGVCLYLLARSNYKQDSNYKDVN